METHSEMKHSCHHHKEHAASTASHKSSDPNAVYTCPMHPEIRQIGPGPCPKCGMALEPLIADDSGNEELADMKRRFALAALFTIPLFIVSMGDLLPGSPISKVFSPKWKIGI